MSEVTKTLANLGSRGQHQANVERDLMSWAKRQMPSALDLYVVDITIVDPTSVGETMVQLPLLLPHELFGALYAANATLGTSQWAPGAAASPGVREEGSAWPWRPGGHQ